MGSLALSGVFAASCNAGSLAEGYLDVAARRQFVIRRTLSSYGAFSLKDYVAQSLRCAGKTCQSRQDLFNIVHEYTSRLLGERVAGAVVKELVSSPVVLTANHHGADFFAQSVQSNIVFGLRSHGGGGSSRTIPVFACGAIPLNNLTFPRGLLLYRCGGAGETGLPIKLPVFPDRLKSRLVSTVAGLDRGMIDRGLGRASRLAEEDSLPSQLEETVRNVLLEDYAASEVLDCNNYSDQSVILNHRLFKRMFRDAGTAPDLVYLEIERIASALLVRDLADTDSLAENVWFNRPVLESLLEALDGERACWDRNAIEARLLGGSSPNPSSVGTVFFWAIDAAGRRAPLSLRADVGEVALVGVSARGERLKIPFTRGALIDGLESRSLIPSVFTSYLVVALARGVTCVGGYYQAEYLPAMQRAVAAALDCDGSLGVFSERVRLVPTSGYMSGIQAVMTESAPGVLSPAGVIETIAGGGLGSEDLVRIAALGLRDAHLGSVTDTVLDVASDQVGCGDWQARIGADLYRRIGTRVVVR